jgi:hypothetical protein
MSTGSPLARRLERSRTTTMNVNVAILKETRPHDPRLGSDTLAGSMARGPDAPKPTAGSQA